MRLRYNERKCIMNPNQEAYLKHYYGLDLIKVLASAFIVFHHFQQITGARFRGVNFYGGRIPFERIVELFFLISGALIYISDNKAINKYKFSKTFNRISRFYPITTLAFVIIYTAGEIQYHLFQTFPTSAEYHSVKCIITSITLTHRGFPLISVERAINNPTWYLCVLIVCYLVYYLFLIIEKRFRIKVEVLSVVFLTTVIILDKCNVPFVYSGGVDSIRGFKMFFLGLIFAYLSKFITSLIRLLLFNIGFIILGLINIALINSNRLLVVIYILLALLLINELVIERTIKYNLKKSKKELIKTLSDVSFDVYVLHIPIYACLNLIIQVFEIQVRNSIVFMIIFITIVEVISYIVFRFVDKPTRKWISLKINNIKMKGV